MARNMLDNQKKVRKLVKYPQYVRNCCVLLVRALKISEMRRVFFTVQAQVLRDNTSVQMCL